MSIEKLPKIAVLASGDGSNFEAIVRATQVRSLSAVIVGLICNIPGAQVLKRAEKLGVSFVILPAKGDREIADQLSRWSVDWVALAGFTGLIGPLVLEKFSGRIVNSHPSLLPRYGGKGMYGHRVHAAVLAGCEKETGVSIHLVNERFDEGRVLAQMRVPVMANDTQETLASRVQQVEHQFYPQVLQELVTGRIKC